MQELTECLLNARKKTLFRAKPVYESRSRLSEDDLSACEAEHGIRFPDDLYSFPANSKEIYFLSRKTPEWARIADSFQQFLEHLEERDFDVCDWAMALRLKPCAQLDTG